MMKYIYSILTTEESNIMTLQNLVFVALIALIFCAYKKNNTHWRIQNGIGVEGFAQRDAFVMKQNKQIYDDFYCSVYDTLSRTGSRSEWELMKVLKMTEPSTSQSVFLDVGCGCGYKVDQLRQAGYRAYGLDISPDMVKRAKEMYPEIHITEGDVLNPMVFDKSIFSHILCTHFTIYEIENKANFFRNCHAWMIPNGYLILHLVDPASFHAVVPVSKNKWRPKDPHSRLTDTLVKFDDFHYHAHYSFSASPEVVFTETFTDMETGKIRKNEQMLYMESIRDILGTASQCGFVFQAKVEMTDGICKDANQFLYVLERIM